MRPKFFILTLALCLFAWCATAQKVKDFANRATLQSNDLFSVSINAGAGTRHVSFGQFQTSLGTPQLWGYVSTNQLATEEWSAARMPLPVRAWGTWNDWTTDTTTDNHNTETYFKTQCDWYATNGMRDAGFTLMIVEEGWNGGLNPDGTFIANPTNYPSGMAAAAAYAKSKGFVPGIYTSLAANSPATTCMGWPGTCYTNLEKQVQQFVDWGFEFIFFDNCNGYDQWTQAPAGTAVAQAGDFDALYLERCRLAAAAVIKTRRNPGMLIVSPQEGTETVRLNPDPRGTALQNIYAFQGTGSWDFIPPSATLTQIEEFYRTNWVYAENYTRRGVWPYGHIINFNMYLPDTVKLTLSLGAILPACNFTASPSGRRTDPYGPTWYDVYTTLFLTNQCVSQIQMDSAALPGRWVWTNANCSVWVRPLGGLSSGTNAVMILNHSGSTQNVTISNAWLNATASQLLSFDSAWDNWNNEALGLANATFSVPANSVKLYRSYPQPSAGWVSIGGRDITLAGSGSSIITVTSYGPAPFYNVDGIAQAAGGYDLYWYFTVPPGAHRATIASQWYDAAAATVAWTNEPAVEYYHPSAGRIIKNYANDSAISNSVTICNSGASSWVTNIVGISVQTNLPVQMTLMANASTNNSGRYMIGQMLVKWE